MDKILTSFSRKQIEQSVEVIKKRDWRPDGNMQRAVEKWLRKLEDHSPPIQSHIFLIRIRTKSP